MRVGAVVASVATLVLGYLMGIGFGALFEQFRTMAIDSVFDDRGDGEPPYQAIWGTVGFLGCLCRTTEVGTAAGAGVAEVLFDPERPTHDKSIFVALRRHPARGDWLPAG